MSHKTAIVILAGICFLASCSLTPPSPPMPDGDFRPVNQPIQHVSHDKQSKEAP